MAILKDYPLPAGTNLNDFFEEIGFEYVAKKETYIANNLYIKIETINTTTTTANIYVSFKKDDMSKVLLSKEYQFEIDMSDGSRNLFEQGYEYLKTLEEFKGAISV